jgi:prophage tail gpP-like protein
MSVLDVSTTSLKRAQGLAAVTSLRDTGRFPPIELIIRPLEADRLPRVLNRFLSYEYNSSILTPVDTFSFQFKAPDSPNPIKDFFRCGDIAVLKGNEFAFCTGIIDDIDMETTDSEGESVRVNGRDPICQFEDNSAISITDTPIYANTYTLDQVIRTLIENTRITKYRLQDAPTGSYLFSTEPGENKLTALTRFIEPLNCVAWTDGDGTLVVGRPNMAQESKGRLYINKAARKSNVMSMKVTEQATRIPNIIVPIWSGQESVTDRVGAENRLYNALEEPTRLRKLGHRVIRTVVVSNPDSSTPQGQAGVNALTAGGQNILQSYAKRELARANTSAKMVQVVVPGHYNELGEPYAIDTCYDLELDRFPLQEKMYLYETQYMGGNDVGQRTILRFCPLGTIVSDVRAQ